MKPVLIQTLMKKKKTTEQPLSKDLSRDKSTSLANFILWALAATVVLSLILS